MADVGENLWFQLLARVGDVLCVLEGVMKVLLCSSPLEASIMDVCVALSDQWVVLWWSYVNLSRRLWRHSEAWCSGVLAMDLHKTVALSNIMVVLTKRLARSMR
jgi:hypothetical protein